jgi:CopA family copper-resistance protein
VHPPQAHRPIIILLFCIFLAASAQAALVEYDLAIDRKELNVTGKPAMGMTINGGIPGPVLRFTEGDTARIRVTNNMEVSTSIHWHGILIPPKMDGVPYISFPPIAPGATFTYEFPIRQSGTYWYHSHSGLQEQSGLYGAIVIEPRRGINERDFAVVLSDWTDEEPHEVLRTLKRGSEWFALEKGAGQSILGAARLGRLGAYYRRELLRMPPMDISDVAYDRFLANGKPETSLDAEPGETVRLRIVDGSSTTFFHLEFAGGPMTILSADGQEVEPVQEGRFLIGVAETYDVRIRVPEKGAYELRATAHDGSGYASVWLGSGKRHYATAVPRPNLYHAMGDLSLERVFALTPSGAMGMSDGDVEAGKFDRPGMMGGHMMGHGSHKCGAQMRGMRHTPAPSAKTASKPPSRNGKRYGGDFGWLAADVSSSEALAMDGMDPQRPWPPYKRLRSKEPTGFSPERPVREIRLTLDGDMERYVWFLNNKPLSESDAIRIKKGEVVRFVMINRTMMHHPMHLHGHFFRVLDGQGEHAPLKHTVDVPPMSTTVIEFDADEFGDWFFHCHLLYHLKSGMARVVHYDGYDPGPEIAAIRPQLYRESWYGFGMADVMSHMSEGYGMLSDTRNLFTAAWEVGWQKVGRTEGEALVTYGRYVNRFFTLFGGADLLSSGHTLEESRGVFGIRYLLPLNVESRAWADTDGGGRFYLEKSFELTPRLRVLGEVQYDTHEEWEGSADIAYMLSRSFSLKGGWHSDYGFGIGVRLRF